MFVLRRVGVREDARVDGASAAPIRRGGRWRGDGRLQAPGCRLHGAARPRHGCHATQLQLHQNSKFIQTLRGFHYWNNKEIQFVRVLIGWLRP